LSATLSSSNPEEGEPHADRKRNGCAFLSVKCPTGCSSEAVNWNASVIRPIWA